jgi:hypothetical protein
MNGAHARGTRGAVRGCVGPAVAVWPGPRYRVTMWSRDSMPKGLRQAGFFLLVAIILALMLVVANYL